MLGVKMRLSLVSKGASRYVVGEVERFDQKNQGWKRATWDPVMLEAGRAYYRKYDGRLVPQEKDGFTLKEMALEMAAWHVALDFSSGQFVGGEGLEAWEARPVGRTDTTRMPKGLKLEADTAQMTRIIKKAAKLYGASLVGVCGLDRRWLYSHSYHTLRKEHKPIGIGEEYRYAIVMAYEMDYEGIKQAPNHIADAAAASVYSRMPVTAALLAQYIRGLGYKAIPMGNDTALSIPLAIDAGLGELSRMGLLITRTRYGPRVRLNKIFTDMPLLPDSPVEFGVWDFCMRCDKCARSCPGQAIGYGPPTDRVISICNRPGLFRWPIDAEKCFGYISRMDTDCAVCMRVCPFNKGAGILHEWVRWGVKNTRWLHSLFITMDNLWGYGKQATTERFWR